MVFLVHQLLQRGLGVQLPFIDAYLDPFAAGVLAPAGIVIERRLIWRMPDPRLTFWQVVIVVGMVALISEALLPRWFDGFVRDGWDYLAFFAGGLLYFVLQGRR